MIKFIQKTPFEVLVDISLFPKPVQQSMLADKDETLVINTLTTLLESPEISDTTKENIIKLLNADSENTDKSIQEMIEKEPRYLEEMSNEDYNFKRNFLIEQLKDFLQKELKFNTEDERSLFITSVETILEFLELDEVDDEADFEEIFNIYKNLAASNYII